MSTENNTDPAAVPVRAHDGWWLYDDGGAVASTTGGTVMKQTSSDKPTLWQRIRCFISYAHDWKFIDDWRCELQKCVLCKAERFVD